jgi:hypothetical protein
VFDEKRFGEAKPGAPMSHSTPESLRFPPVAGLTIRGEFDGGPMSTDIGLLLLREVDRQGGLTERLAQAIEDRRHPSYVNHPLRDLLAQRIYQIACGYEDANDANPLRHDPLFQLALERDPLSEAVALASGADLLAAGEQRQHPGSVSGRESVRGGVHGQLRYATRADRAGLGSLGGSNPR